MEEGVVRPGDGGTPQGAGDLTAAGQPLPALRFDLWAQQWRQRHAQGDVHPGALRRRHRRRLRAPGRGRAFLADMRERMAAFGLALHPEKTRLIEFGRFAAANRQARRLGQAGDVHLPGLHPHLRVAAGAAASSSSGSRAATGCAPSCGRSRRRCVAGCTGRSTSKAPGWAAWSRASSPYHASRPTARVVGLPPPRERPLWLRLLGGADSATARRGKGSRARRSLAAQARHPSSLAQPNASPSVTRGGARCGNAHAGSVRGCVGNMTSYRDRRTQRRAKRGNEGAPLRARNQALCLLRALRAFVVQSFLLASRRHEPRRVPRSIAAAVRRSMLRRWPISSRMRSSSWLASPSAAMTSQPWRTRSRAVSPAAPS